jgi:hypothetical protein
MTYSTRPPVHPRFSSPPDELDGMLCRFYRAQLPDPWPGPPTVPSLEKTAQVPRKLSFFRLPARVAVAAAVALLVFGYLALQSWFPDPRPVKPLAIEPGPIGKNQKPKYRVEERQPANNPGGRLIIAAEDLGAKK